MPPEACPNCGAPVPDGARACPECGADERTGWADAATAQRLGLPDDGEEFDHDRFVREEFGGEAPRRRGLPRWLVAAVALGLIALFLAWFAGRF